MLQPQCCFHQQQIVHQHAVITPAYRLSYLLQPGFSATLSSDSDELLRNLVACATLTSPKSEPSTRLWRDTTRYLPMDFFEAFDLSLVTLMMS
jgi:hypothetical protein